MIYCPRVTLQLMYVYRIFDCIKRIAEWWRKTVLYNDVDFYVYSNLKNL